ncbi:MAG: MarR family transcriptional regulator [Thaumarchaeota archaeon]|nr:MarR family transcriptional regulator [Nitrososphaerota archaeon]MCL5318233.1 MarR family transcriptional regulator [Nitrososphaerota archaeon]
MALHNYTIEILGSKASFRVLKTLLRFRGKIFTIRELAKTAGLSHPETSKVLKTLEKRGVVRLQPVGRAYQVSLNEESYILKSVIEPLFRAEENTVGALISTIKPFFNKDKRISTVAIFGSVAKGMEKESSDIDLLVIAEDREFANECVSRASDATTSKFGFAPSPLIMSKERFIQESDRDLEKSILESYTLVSGKDLKEIIKHGKASR